MQVGVVQVLYYFHILIFNNAPGIMIFKKIDPIPAHYIPELVISVQE